MQAFHIFLLTLLLQLGSTQQPRMELTLDILTIPPPASRPEKTIEAACGCGAGIGGIPYDPPVKVTLVHVTPDTFTIGAAIVLELLVEHVGRTPIPIAISRDPDLAPSCRRAEGDVRTMFPLFSKDTHELIAISPVLYGSESSAATTMTLRPGEQLRVRVPATVTGIDRKHPQEEDPQHVQLEAVFHTEWDQCRGVYERSQATVPAFLSRPRQGHGSR
jgi:hypothetical protein